MSTTLERNRQKLPPQGEPAPDNPGPDQPPPELPAKELPDSKPDELRADALDSLMSQQATATINERQQNALRGLGPLAGHD